jgi:hypothetical protein
MAKVQASFLAAGWRRATQAASATKMSATSQTGMGKGGPVRNESVRGAVIAPMERATVTTEPVEVAPLAVGVRLVGDSVHVEFTGAPVQVNATGVVNPLRAVTVTVKLTLLPAATLADDGDTAMLKSGPPLVPVPVSAAVCGPLGSLSATLKVAVAAAAAVGVNVTLMVQAAPAARVVPQVVVSANNDADVPPMETAMALKGEVVLLLRVTIFAGLVVLMDWLPKATVAGVRNIPVGGVVPVPVSAIVCGLLGSLSTTVSAAFSVAVVEAVKIISMVQFEPAANVVVQVEVPRVKSVALAPVNEMVMPVSVAEVLLYKVTVFSALGECST